MRKLMNTTIPSSYWVVAKFTSKSTVSAGEVESQVKKALKDLRKGIRVEIVQLGYT
ncbi:MAG: hypothetical protein ACRD8Z_15510 [Nitrososphaeraceae archaeon]